ncbi:tol-pal system YbgF family protein [Flavobacterium chuncheonense]|jgi:tetratricopeptide (TPR) repeat protein|uniref:Tol-pal system YbgF family protein n=1 Tax=Flavobacterium chuncheonense TaxID=2026653 RepID=A0ABW5YKQ2_9FLAO
MATYNKRGYKAPKPEVVEDIENEFEEVVETGESTTEEVFNTLDETASKTEEWVAGNQKIILGVVGAIAVATILFIMYNNFIVQPKEDEALNSVYQAQTYFDEALTNTQSTDSLFKLALNGAEGKLGFVGVAEEFSGTKAGNLANYYAGMSYLNLKDFQNAEKYLLAFKSDDQVLKALALGGIGDAYVETNKIDDAMAYYKKAAEANDNDFTTPKFLFKAAQLAMLNNKNEEAHGLFLQIKEKYETSREAANIDAFIAMTE